MCKIDITKDNLYIAKCMNVIKSKSNLHHKLLHVKCRHSDAFVYILSGSCKYRFPDGEEFTANEGNIIYLAHHSEYTMYIYSDTYSYIFCDFEFNETAPRKSAVYTQLNTDYAENLFVKLLKSKDNFTDAFSLLYNIYGEVITTANKTYISKSAKSKIAAAKSHIDKSFTDQALSVSLLAKNASMSEVYFRRLFKSEYKISPSQYITSVRLKNAKNLMKYPFLTLDDCSLQSGFSSVQYFCRTFKKNTGITPSEYRRQLK